MPSLASHILRKAAGKAIEAAECEERSSKVVNLMEALRQSVSVAFGFLLTRPPRVKRQGEFRRVNETSSLDRVFTFQLV
jgi:non-homologous end joining protein Ku